ncbi:ArsR/SmtB family transcription factor [Deinococcus pimensis]|uniref:ArsR/SmtB family transcription factor n=1 Tax=Deinococcus pimensis TaxID=309888 RepID=UPI001B7F9A18
MLVALLDGRALPAGELAFHATVSPQTASAHLYRLLDGGLLCVQRQGRHRYYCLASEAVADAVEALAVVAKVSPRGTSARDPVGLELRFARACYQHLAGRLGVSLTDALLAREVLERVGDQLQITASGREWLREFGVHVPQDGRTGRPVARACLDWSERRVHLAGPLGGALMSRLFELGWIARIPGGRVIRVTLDGRRGFAEEFLVDVSQLERAGLECERIQQT